MREAGTGSLRWWAGRGLVLAGAAGVPVGAARPWLAIGGVHRSAFSLARHASQLGIVHTPGARAVVVALFLSPAVFGVVVIATALGWRRRLALLGATVGLVAWGTGLVGLRFGPTTKLGPLVTALAGSCCLIGALAVYTAPSGTAPSGTAPSGTAPSGTAPSGTAPSARSSSRRAEAVDAPRASDGDARPDSREHPPTRKDHQ